MRKIVAVIGDRWCCGNSTKAKMAFELGKALIDNGYRVLSGGGAGIMETVMQGAKSSDKYKEGDTIAILPGFDDKDANDFADIIIPTGLDIYRDAIVANSYAVVAIGGGVGTLNEMTFAWNFKRLMIAYTNVEGWSSKMAGVKMDQYVRYENIPEDQVFPTESAVQTIALLEKYINLYTQRHIPIAVSESGLIEHK